jgi:hypothetical protein
MLTDEQTTDDHRRTVLAKPTRAATLTTATTAAEADTTKPAVLAVPGLTLCVRLVVHPSGDGSPQGTATADD